MIYSISQVAPLRRGLRSLAALALLAGAALLGGCASVDVRSYANEKPTLDLAQFFNGPVQAWGLVTDRSGKVVRRFTVQLDGRWQGQGDAQTGTLDEHFTYSDGKTERRVWTLRKQPGGRYIGTAADVVGEALGQAAGNALNWHYTLRLPVDGSVYDVQFDDWFYQMDDKTLLNRAQMSKFGFKLADVTIAFRKP